MPSFIPELGSTLHLVGVCVNRIGKPQTINSMVRFGSDREAGWRVPINVMTGVLQVRTAEDR